jgi:hypothetical protein
MVKARKSQAGLWVVYSDVHWPTTSMDTFDAMLDFIRRNKRKIRGAVDLGDTFDNESIAHHNKGKALFQVPGSFAGETKSFDAKFLTPLEAALPKNAEKVIITGNHTRFEQDYIEVHPELAGLVDRFSALKLADRGWTIIPLGMEYQLGKLTCVHGEQLSGAYGSTAMPARKAVEVYSGNVIQGHTHSPQSFCRVSPVRIEEKRMGYVSPILGTVNARFMRNKPNAWANGFAIVDVREGGSFNAYLVIVCRGEFSFSGEVYSAKNFRHKAA